MSRFGCLNVKSNSRCNDRPKEIQRDVPCINIILRSDCKMHSNQYNYVQKEDAQNENKSAPQNIEHLTQTNMSGLNLSNKKYHSICFNADNDFNVLQTVGMKCEANLGRHHTAFDVENNLNVSQSGVRNGAQYDLSTEQSSFSNTPQIEYGRRRLSCYPFHSTKISNDAINSKLISSKITSSILEKTDRDDKIETSFDADTSDVKSGMKSYKRVSWKNIPEYKLRNNKNKELVNLEQVDTGKQNLARVPRENKSLLQNFMMLGNTDLNSKSINTFMNSTFQRIENSSSSADYKHSICTNRTPYVTKNLIDNDKIENIICTSKVYNISENNCGKHISQEESTFNKITQSSKKLNFSVQDDMNFCTVANCTKTDCSALTIKKEKKHKNTCTDIKSTNDATTNTFLKSEKNVCCNKGRKEKESIKTIDTALDTLQDMLNGIKKLEDKGTIKQHTQACHYQEVRCKNMDCNYSDGRHEVTVLKCKHDSVKPSELMTPECMKMLQEIKEQTKTLEEQLIIMNKNIKIKKKTIEKLMPTVECTLNLKYNQDTSDTRQQRDMITQNPEKRNICIQEPSKDINHVNCAQYTTIKMEENDEKQNVALLQINKKDKYQREEEQESKNSKKEEIKDYKKENSNVENQIKRQEDTKRTQNIKVQCVRSFHIIDPLNFRPLLTCLCNKEVNVSNNKNSVCIQNGVARKKNLHTQRINKAMIDKLIIDSVKMKTSRTNLINVNNEQESLTCEEKAIMMLLLAKSISNKCLKSKYKKSELINFRPKCISNSCISCDQKFVKCKPSKRKVQIPVVFKQSKPTKCRIEGNICSNENRYEYSSKQLENNYQLSDVASVCTQSSNLHITTATSVSCTTISTKSMVDNVTGENRRRGDACILS